MNVFPLTTTLDRYFSDWCTAATDAEILVVGGKKIDLKLYPKLRYIFKCGVGTDNIPNLSGTDIKLVMPSARTANAIYDEVAAFTISRILTCHYANSGDLLSWKKYPRPALAHRQALVIGMGNIGERVYRLLDPMVGAVRGFDVASGDKADELPDALRQADIISLHVPLTEHTRGMIDCQNLKTDVCIANTARAELVNEEQLNEFLKHNSEAQAAFDVFWQEPYAGPLLARSNFHGTPHLASMSAAFYEGLYQDLLDLIKGDECDLA